MTFRWGGCLEDGRGNDRVFGGGEMSGGWGWKWVKWPVDVGGRNDGGNVYEAAVVD